MLCRLAVLLTLVLACHSPAAESIEFGRTTHFRTSASSTIVDLAFSPDGKTIVAGHTQRLGLTAWDAATGAKKWTADLNRELDDNDRLRLAVPMHVLVVGNEVVTLEAAPQRWRYRIARFRLTSGERTAVVDLPRHGRVEEFRFSPDGTRLAYHEDETCYVIDTKTGRDVWRFPLERDIGFRRSITFAPDGKTLTATTAVNDFAVFSLETGRQVAKIGTPPNPGSVEGNLTPLYSPDGKWLLTLPDDGNGPRTLYQTATNQVIGLNLPQRGLRPAFSPDGRYLLIASVESDMGRIGVNVFPLPERYRNPPWLIDLPRPAHAVAYAPDGKTIAVASKNAVTLLDAATGRRRPQSAERVGGFTAVAVTDRGRVVTLADDVEEWDAKTGTRTRVLPSPAGPGRWAALSPDGRWAAWKRLTFDGATYEYWDAAAARHLGGPWPRDTDLPYYGVTNHGREIRLDAEAGADFYGLTLRDFSTGAGRVDLTRVSHNGPQIGGVVASADARTVVVLHGPDYRVVLTPPPPPLARLHWHDATGRKVGETEPVWCDTQPVVAVSADGGLAALNDAKTLNDDAGRVVRTDRGVNLFHVRPGGGQKPALRFAIPRGPHLMAFAPDGRTLAVVLDGDAAGYRVTLYETASGLLRQECRLPDLGQAVAFTPDGSHLVAAAADGPGVIFDLWATREAFDADRDWAKLLGTDGERAFAAMRAMAASPAAAVAFLRDRVKPVPVGAEAKLNRWIADLDAPAFADREAATKELREVVIDFRGTLEAEMNRTPSVEARERLEKILKPSDAVAGELLRQYRAVEVLARIRSPEAKAVLAEVAKGDPARRLTALAKKAMAGERGVVSP